MALSRMHATLAFLATAAGSKCPGSGAWVHAKCEVTVLAQASCADVMDEMEARVAGIQTGAWVDPHNRGTYTLLGREAGELHLQRLTGNKMYTDKQIFTFSDAGAGTCEVSGCSESQGTSIADFSTNYCDLRMLYCGSADGCRPLKRDFAIRETHVQPSMGAGQDPKACLVVHAPAERFLAEESPSSLPTCPPAGFTTVENFNIEAFVKSRWYIQQQMPVSYLPASQNRCVYAEYKLAPKKTFWGYDVLVHNHAEDVAAPHKVHDSGSFICAKIVDGAAGKLEVAPCFLPSVTAGPYWVVDYSEEEGYALISGGAPKNSAPGGCRTGEGVNDSGLWVFTRHQARDEALVKKVRGIAARKGFDVSVLQDVDQTACEAEETVV